jgi:hypothetical protein
MQAAPKIGFRILFATHLTVCNAKLGPSGSLLLSRSTLAFHASCRFIPAHRIGLLSPVEIIGELLPTSRFIVTHSQAYAFAAIVSVGQQEQEGNPLATTS